MRLEDKVALITGGASGMGASMARIFAREGAKVVVADVLDDEGKKVVADITQANGAAIFRHLDVTSEAEWKAAVNARGALSRHEIRDSVDEGGRRRLDRQHLVDFRHHRPARDTRRLQRLERCGAHPDQGGGGAAWRRQYPGQLGASWAHAADALVGAHRRSRDSRHDGAADTARPRRPRR